jgi:hypothetical protein
MNEIRVTPLMQKLIVLGILGAIIAIIAVQLPEIKRYLNVRSMS